MEFFTLLNGFRGEDTGGEEDCSGGTTEEAKETTGIGNHEHGTVRGPRREGGCRRQTGSLIDLVRQRSREGVIRKKEGSGEEEHFSYKEKKKYLQPHRNRWSREGSHTLHPKDEAGFQPQR